MQISTEHEKTIPAGDKFYASLEFPVSILVHNYFGFEFVHVVVISNVLQVYYVWICELRRTAVVDIFVAPSGQIVIDFESDTYLKGLK